MTAWLNGTYYDSSDALLDLTDRGATLADGVFETILIRNNQPVFFDAHLSRLRKGTERFAIPLPMSDAEMFQALTGLILRQKISTAHYAARITLTRGPGARGIVPPPGSETSPSLFMTMAPIPEPAKTPLSLFVSTVRRNEGSPSSNHKTLAYTDNVLARREAAQAGADEAALLNNAADIACASVANLFILKGGERLLTPSLESGALPGIVRGLVIEIARDKGLAVSECKLPVDALADGELFLTNSLHGLRPAYLFGDSSSKTGPSSPSEVFLELQRQYAHRVDIDVKKSAAE